MSDNNSPESAVSTIDAAIIGETLNPSNEPQGIETIDLCSPQGKIDETGNVDHSNEFKLEILDEDTENECDDAGVSEGEDEVHCTQLPKSDEESEEEDAQSNDNVHSNVQQELQENSKVANGDNPVRMGEINGEWQQQTNSSGSVPLSNKNDICFICGTDLTKIKRRVDHIKRCSKKHGITGRDVKINNDHEEFVDINHLQQKDAAKPTNNPYSKFKENDWHGDANKVLQQDANNGGAWSSIKVTLQSATSSSSGGIQRATKQTTLSSFVKMPMRNLNNVLLAGARKVAKVGEITKQKAEARKTNGASSNSRKRRRSSDSNYSMASTLKFFYFHNVFFEFKLTFMDCCR